MKFEFSAAELVPHSGSMSLLDSIVEYGDDWLSAEVIIRDDSMFADENGVPAWIGIEYMAQAVAAYAGLQERLSGGKPKIGFLLGARRYYCSTDCFAVGTKLLLTVKLDMQAANGLNVFRCDLTGERIDAFAFLKVYQPDDPDKYLQDSIT